MVVSAFAEIRVVHKAGKKGQYGRGGENEIEGIFRVTSPEIGVEGIENDHGSHCYKTADPLILEGRKKTDANTQGKTEEKAKVLHRGTLGYVPSGKGDKKYYGECKHA